VTANKGSGSQFGETVYVSKVKGARKVKSNAQVAMNKNSDPVQKFFLGVAGKDGARTQIFPNFRVEPGSSY